MGKLLHILTNNRKHYLQLAVEAIWLELTIQKFPSLLNANDTQLEYFGYILSMKYHTNKAADKKYICIYKEIKYIALDGLKISIECEYMFIFVSHYARFLIFTNFLFKKVCFSFK